MMKSRKKGWRLRGAPHATIFGLSDNKHNVGKVLSVGEGAMYASKKSSLVKKMNLGSKTFIIAPVLASLWLTSCITPQGGRSEQLNLAGRNLGNDGFQNGGDTKSGTVFVADGSGKNGIDPNAFASTIRRVALVIGNSDYSGNIGKLANPTRDAAAIAESLERTGFEVNLLQDVSREEMLRAVLEFDKSLRDTDVGLFYYAGHAVQVNGRNFMIPTEAELNISSTRKDAIADYVALETVEIDDVLARMGNAEADLNIVILDACRNNPFNNGTRGLGRGLAQTSAPRGTFVAYATAPGKVAQDGDSGNSPYTAAIVKNLETPGLKLEDVFKRVRQEVAVQTDGEQIPWENSSVFGDFYFSEPLPEPEPEEVETAALPQEEPEIKAPELSREDYVEVQQLLSRIGYYRGPVTGEPDQKTRDAIILWQKVHGLELDGELSKVQIAFMRTDATRVDDELDPKASDLPPLEGRPKKARPTRKIPEAPAQKWDDIVIPPPPA